MKPFLLVLALLFTQHVLAQDISGNEIIIGRTDSIRSNILNEKRSIWVHLPKGAGDNKNARYPVVYLLDGKDNFAAVSGIITYLSESNGNMICPDMIVVGINNTDRTRDLTPTYSATDFEAKPTTIFKSSGGGEKFIAFVEKELIPYVESKYPVAPYRMLVGHSFGGLTAVNVLLNHTELFNAYTIIDPSMWWNGQKLLRQAHVDLKEKRFEGKSVFIGIANTMPEGMDTLTARKDTTGSTYHIRSILKLIDAFKINPQNRIVFNYAFYKNDDHNSSPLPVENDAFRFIFDYYRLPQSEQKKLFDLKDTADAGSIIQKHYNEVSARLGYKVMPAEALIDEMAHEYLDFNMYTKAYQLFKLNCGYYADSPMVYAGLADYYVALKDNSNAIMYYKKALQITERPDIRKKLNKLTAQK